MADFGSKGSQAGGGTFAPHSGSAPAPKKSPDVAATGTSAKAAGFIQPIGGNNDKNKAK